MKQTALKRGTKPLRKTSSQKKAVAKRAAWTNFSLFIRNRDPFCITCGDITTQAGHFIHNVSNTKLHFDERNVHGQCTRCNMYLSGNLAPYTLFMEDTYGRTLVDRFLYLKNHRDELNEDKPNEKWYNEIRTKYRDLNAVRNIS